MYTIPRLRERRPTEAPSLWTRQGTSLGSRTSRSFWTPTYEIHALGLDTIDPGVAGGDFGVGQEHEIHVTGPDEPTSQNPWRPRADNRVRGSHTVRSKNPLD